ncbi:caspase domain-containing protein [Russula vinacea]|nr:caspase domain-containing protein [Russula vinacea]
MPDEFRYNAPGYPRDDSESQSRPPPLPPSKFPEPNLPGPLRVEHPRLYYHDAPQVETSPTILGDTYLQAPPWPEPRIRVGYDTSQALQQRFVGQIPRSDTVAQRALSPPSRLCTSAEPGTYDRIPVSVSGSHWRTEHVGGTIFSLNEDNRTGRTITASPSSPFTAAVEFPASPQEFDLTGQRIVHPQMPIPLPFFRNTGKRRALIIGINYSLHPRPDLELKKCIEDAYGMANFLCSNLGFAHDDVRVMTNESPWDCPTEANIRHAMRALVFDAQPHDSLLFYFSGHALQAKDMSGHEPNGLAECICAMDYRADHPYPKSNMPGLIADNVMHELMAQPLPQHCRLTAIYDSCHSATLLGLPHLYDSNGMVKPIKHPERLKILRQRGSRADIVSLSASRDDEEAFETERGGALRWAFIETVRKFGDALTYKELLWSVRLELRGIVISNYMRSYGFPQRPQLSTSREIDTNLRFTT